MTESSLLDELDIRRVDPQSTDFQTFKDKLAAATHAKVTFPMVEIEPGVFRSDSDELIAYYARRAHVDPRSSQHCRFT